MERTQDNTRQNTVNGATESGRSRNWLFTCNRFGNDDIERLAVLGKDMSVAYLVYGHEVAPTTGHVHLQGFVRFRNARKFSGVREFFSTLTHADLRQGDNKAVEMMKYCQKGGKFVEFGKRPMYAKEAGAKGAKKSDAVFKAVNKHAEAGNFKWIKKNYPALWMRHYRTYHLMFKDYGSRPKDLDDVCGVWIFGASGVGKSHYAREKFPGFYDKACNKWWDNYQGEANVIVDDFDQKHDCLAHHLKRWADKYYFSAEVKGGQINCRPQKVIVTSQYRIEEIWSDKETCDALNRRFIKIKISINSLGERVVRESGFQ